MDGAAGHLDAVREGLMLGVKAGKGGQQGGVDVEDTLGKLPNEMAAEKTHISSQTDEIDTVLTKQISDLQVKSSAIEPGGLDYATRQAEFPGARETRRIGLILKNEANFGVETAALDVGGNGFEVGAPSGKQNAEPPPAHK